MAFTSMDGNPVPDAYVPAQQDVSPKAQEMWARGVRVRVLGTDLSVCPSSDGTHVYVIRGNACDCPATKRCWHLDNRDMTLAAPSEKEEERFPRDDDDPQTLTIAETTKYGDRAWWMSHQPQPRNESWCPSCSARSTSEAAADFIGQRSQVEEVRIGEAHDRLLP